MGVQMFAAASAFPATFIVPGGGEERIKKQP